MNMDFEEYSVASIQMQHFKVDGDALHYLFLSFAGESGELMSTYQKYVQGKLELSEIRQELLLELGDCLWNLNQIAEHLASDLETVAKMNISKLQDKYSLE